MTGEKRRASAPSRSIVRYSASVVAPTIRSSPRASSGLRMFAASIAPSAWPAPSTVCSSSTNRTMPPSEATTSASAAFSRCSNWPRYWAPASMPARSSATTRASRSASGTSPSAIRSARPSAIAVLPTPASPISTALFLRRRARISIVCSISSARPITGSMRPSAASAVRSRPNSSSAGVVDCGSAGAASGAAPPAAATAKNSRAQTSHRAPARRPPSAASTTRTLPGRWPQFAQTGKPSRGRFVGVSMESVFFPNLS